MADELEISKISNSKELEAFLKGKPKEWSQIIALRTAMRVFPFVLNPRIAVRLGKRKFTEFTLSIWRATITSVFATISPSTKISIHTAARTADATFGSDADSGAARAAAFATAFSASTTYAPDAAKFAVDAATYTVDAAAYASNATVYTTDASAFWQKVLWDLKHLEDGDTLLSWPLFDHEFSAHDREVFEWQQTMLAHCEAFAQHEDIKNTPWVMISDWYRTIVTSDFRETPWGDSGDAIDEEIATKSNDFWERDPDDVMADIAEIVGWPDYGKGQPVERDETEEEALPQISVTYRFGFKNGQFHLLPPDPELSVAESYRDGMWRALKDAIAALVATRSNSNAFIPQRYLDTIQSLAAKLGDQPTNARPEDLQPIWRVLSREMAKLAKEGGTGAETLDDAIDDIEGALEDLRACYKDTALHEREMIRVGVTPRTVDQVVGLLEELADTLDGADISLLPEDVRAALKANLGYINSEEDADTKSDLAAEQVMTHKNFGSLLRNEIRFIGNQTYIKSRDNIIDGTAKGIGFTVRWGIVGLAASYFEFLTPLVEVVPSIKPLYEHYQRLEKEGLLDKPDAPPDVPDDNVDV